MAISDSRAYAGRIVGVGGDGGDHHTTTGATNPSVDLLKIRHESKLERSVVLERYVVQARECELES